MIDITYPNRSFYIRWLESENHADFILEGISSLPDDLAKQEYLARLVDGCRLTRKAKYDSLNQFEVQYDDLINGTTLWKDTITEIKATFPKPEVTNE